MKSVIFIFLICITQVFARIPFCELANQQSDPPPYKKCYNSVKKFSPQARVYGQFPCVNTACDSYWDRVKYIDYSVTDYLAINADCNLWFKNGNSGIWPPESNSQNIAWVCVDRSAFIGTTFFQIISISLATTVMGLYLTYFTWKNKAVLKNHQMKMIFNFLNIIIGFTHVLDYVYYLNTIFSSENLEYSYYSFLWIPIIPSYFISMYIAYSITFKNEWFKNFFQTKNTLTKPIMNFAYYFIGSIINFTIGTLFLPFIISLFEAPEFSDAIYSSEKIVKQSETSGNDIENGKLLINQPQKKYLLFDLDSHNKYMSKIYIWTIILGSIPRLIMQAYNAQKLFYVSSFVILNIFRSTYEVIRAASFKFCNKATTSANG